MIKSLNADPRKRFPSIAEVSGYSDERGAVWHALDKNYLCDCCAAAKVAVKATLDGASFYEPPRLVEVNGVVYVACSEACARILFMIHHQYALQEKAGKNGEVK